MLDPVKNSSPSDKCANPIGSDCVLWAGGTPPGLSLCKGATLTQVINQVAAKASDAGACCSGSFPPGHASCYTGAWINVPSIPSGSGVGYTYAISALSGVQYKWSPDGDLLLRGGFNLSISPTITQTTGLIPLFSVPVTCLPTGWIMTQAVLTAVYSGNNDAAIVISGSFGTYLEHPTGIVGLSFNIIDLPITPVNLNISLGGIRFNNA